MVTTKSIIRLFSALLSVMVLLPIILPARAELLSGPRYLGGNFFWTKRLGGTGTEFSSAIALDSFGNIYTTGEFTGTVDFNPGADIYNLISAGDYADIFVSKLDNNGNFVWAKRMGGTGNDKSRGIAIDMGGNVYTTGIFEDTADFDPGAGTSGFTSAGYLDIFVSKLDGNGNFVWAKRMGGSASDDYGLGIAVDSAGVYTTGYFSGTADFDPSGTSAYELTSTGGEDVFVSKLSNSGTFLWAKRMGGADGDFSNSIVVNANSVYTTGYFIGTSNFGAGNLISAGYTDIFISKLDTSGNAVWAKRMGGLGYDKSYSIALDPSNYIYATGFFEGTVDFGTGNLVSAGFEDIFVAKLDSSSTTSWAKRMGGASGESGQAIAVDSNGNVYTTGVFSGTADFDPGTGVTNLTYLGMQDIFISKLSTSGSFVWAKRMGGMFTDAGNSITEDPDNNIYTTGYFEGVADFGINNLTSAGSGDIYVAKIGDFEYHYLYLPLIRR